MGKARLFWASAVDGGWLTERRAAFYPAVAIAGLALGLAIAFVFFPPDDGYEGRVRFGIDFVLPWSTAWLAANGRAADVYDFDILGPFQESFTGYPGVRLAFPYPPMYLLAVYPLSLLTSYWIGLGTWLSLTGAGYLWALWRAWPGWRTLWIGVASPVGFIVAINGQNGFLTAALMGGGLVLLPSRPVLAGVLLGAATIKPHIGILVPIAFIAARQWAAFAAAAATALALALAATGLFGLDAWRAYVLVMTQMTHLLDNEWLPLWKVQSVYAAAAVAGLPPAVGHGLQGTAFVAAAGAVAWAWRRNADHRLKTAALLFATPLATPYIHDYDLPFVAVGAACLCHYGAERGFRSYEKTLMAVLWLLPFFARTIAASAHITLTPWLMAAALALTLRRMADDSTIPKNRGFDA